MKLALIPNLLRNKRAVSAVISNLILISAVIVVGFAALAFTQSSSYFYAEQYSQDVNSDINKLKEKLAFEFVFYNRTEKVLRVYIINCGKTDNVTMPTAYVSDAFWGVTFSSIALKFLNNTSTNKLDQGQEGFFALSTALVGGNGYSLRIVTGRGSSFDVAFVA
jgi:hypothetical protein